MPTEKSLLITIPEISPPPALAASRLRGAVVEMTDQFERFMPENLLKKILIIGYGNPDREDDGVAWHVLCNVAQRLNRPVPEDYQEGFPETNENPELFFELQLIPENAEIVGLADLVFFVDAHTGNIPEDLQAKPLSPFYQASPFTHHLTPETCLSLAETIYGKSPEAYLITIRGFEFGFSRSLSPKTQELAAEASDKIFKMISPYL